MRPKKTSQFQPIPTGHIYNIFPTPFYKGMYNYDHSSVTNQVKENLKLIKDDNPKRSYTNYFFDDIRRDMCEQSWFNDFANAIKDTYVDFCATQFGHEFHDIDRSEIHLFAWASQYKENLHHESHNHSQSLISGTYYPRVRGSAQPIQFYNPTGQIFSHEIDIDDGEVPAMPNTTYRGQEGSHDAIFIHPEEGEVLMWPAYLMHSVDSPDHVTEDYDRIAISFNLYHHNIRLNNTEWGDRFDYGQLYR